MLCLSELSVIIQAGTTSNTDRGIVHGRWNRDRFRTPNSCVAQIVSKKVILSLSVENQFQLRQLLDFIRCKADLVVQNVIVSGLRCADNSLVRVQIEIKAIRRNNVRIHHRA